MILSEMTFSGAVPVEGYGPGFFRFGGQVFRGPVLAHGETVGGWGGLDDLPALLALAGEIDVLLLGTGAEMAPPPAGWRRALEEAGTGVEVMATPAACRSYNVLLTEARRVALAALPV